MEDTTEIERNHPPLHERRPDEVKKEIIRVYNKLSKYSPSNNPYQAEGISKDYSFGYTRTSAQELIGQVYKKKKDERKGFSRVSVDLLDILVLDVENSLNR